MNNNIITISIEELSVMVQIGVYEWEQRIKRNCLISVTINIDGSRIEKSKKLKDGINYDDIISKIENLCTTKQFILKEDLMYEIRDLVKKYNNVISTDITIHKLGICNNAKSVKVSGFFSFL